MAISELPGSFLWGNVVDWLGERTIVPYSLPSIPPSNVRPSVILTGLSKV